MAQCAFIGTCVLELESNGNSEKASHRSTKFNLELSPNLERSVYLDKDDYPTKDGARVLTQVFTQALIGNIHACHEQGFMDSAEHLRMIIAELERGFIQVTEMSKSRF